MLVCHASSPDDKSDYCILALFLLFSFEKDVEWYKDEYITDDVVFRTDKYFTSITNRSHLIKCILSSNENVHRFHSTASTLDPCLPSPSPLLKKWLLLVREQGLRSLLISAASLQRASHIETGQAAFLFFIQGACGRCRFSGTCDLIHGQMGGPAELVMHQLGVTVGDIDNIMLNGR